MERVRKEKINSQLINALMIVSSCLKGGLSFIQAIEVLVEEMPPPISQEFGLVLRENKMGLSLEESLRRMHERLRISDLSMAITAILVARETGGDLTKVLSRLITNIRDNTKLKENIRNLTLQGRMQGMIMTVLPFVFIAIVISFDKHHFDIMFASQQGRLLLALAIILQIIGIVLIQKFSILKI
jgi:tight adherence protein B